jgi:hypothetical protein
MPGKAKLLRQKKKSRYVENVEQKREEGRRYYKKKERQERRILRKNFRRISWQRNEIVLKHTCACLRN